MCSSPSGRNAKSTSGRRRSSRLPPATWPVPVIFWCWLRAEAKYVDLNLDTLKLEIQEYLNSKEFAVFRSSPGSLEGNPMVMWDAEKHPDYQMFLDVAQK